MSNFNFNVGDKVINLKDLSLWDNVYHFDKFEHSIISTVSSANERYFSISNFDVQNKMDFYGSDTSYVYLQKDGSWLSYHPTWITKLYHFDRDRDIVIAHLKKLFTEAMYTADNNDLKEIASLEAQISNLQKRIDSIKAGLRPSIKGDLPQKDFLNARFENLMKKFQS